MPEKKADPKDVVLAPLGTTVDGIRITSQAIFDTYVKGVKKEDLEGVIPPKSPREIQQQSLKNWNWFAIVDTKLGKIVGARAVIIRRAPVTKKRIAVQKRVFVRKEFRGRDYAKIQMLLIEAFIKKNRINDTRMELYHNNVDQIKRAKSAGFKELPKYHLDQLWHGLVECRKDKNLPREGHKKKLFGSIVFRKRI
ncbi:MAG: hypothetical protein Q7K42_04865 [Candidatus Diapherotrites archaeon]|nr:hypothetical protein [Candidatus Diapherotrites archaeon]